MHRTAIAWFRRDLRLADNPALTYALAHAEEVVPVFAVPSEVAPGRTGTAGAEWLQTSLGALDLSLRERGASLLLTPGPAPEVLAREAARLGATLVTCTRDWAPAAMAEERAAATALASVGAVLRVEEGQLLVAPGCVTTGSGSPYSVFTPFSRAWQSVLGALSPLPAPARIAGGAGVMTEVAPRRDAATVATEHAATSRIAVHWTPGEIGAQERLATFIADALAAYDTARDIPSREGTSRLSPHLAWGEISPRQVVAAVTEACGEVAVWPFVRQVAWREFAYHVLHAHPETAREPLRPAFAAFPWRDDAEGTAAWLDGRTGFPIVDAGMRQLAQSGWMHNRVRLIAASFLTKDLLVPWQTGEAAFLERLVDYDPAANVFNWQWVAGSGADAAPYFRIFNPTVQGRRFDPAGEYVRRWVPELARLDARWIHAPHLAPSPALADAGLVPGETYPMPIVDHAEARVRALAALASLRGSR